MLYFKYWLLAIYWVSNCTKSLDYVTLLNNELFKSVQFSEQGHIVDSEFQDDNLCPVHWARTVLDWFAEHETEVPHIIWLTNLLDVNVIEKKIWYMFEWATKKRKQHPINLAE